MRKDVAFCPATTCGPYIDFGIMQTTIDRVQEVRLRLDTSWRTWYMLLGNVREYLPTVLER